MGEQAPGIWRFGQVSVDERRVALGVAGSPVALDRSSYDILLALLRSGGEVVTKAELLAAGWPGRIVSENSLAKAVSRLRQALGEDAAALRVVHGYGYRLAAEVTHAPLPSSAVAAPATDAAHLHAGDALPLRPGWRLARRLRAGRHTAAWLAECEGAQRLVRVALDEPGLNALKREIAAARRLEEAGERGAALLPLGSNLAQAPFFVELPWTEAGTLRGLADADGGLGALPLEDRLAICAAACDAVAALHRVGVIHRHLSAHCVHPERDPGAPGGWRVRLGDLGAEPPVPDGHAPAHAIAPEVAAGGMPTQRSDVFALGVLLLQLAAGDLSRSLAPGWREVVGDPLLCEDIRLAAAADPVHREVDAAALATRLRTLQWRRQALAAEQARAVEEAGRARRTARERSRRRLLLAVSTALALGLAGTTTMYAAAESARKDAEREAARRNAVLAFVTEDILGQADPYRNPGASASLPLLEAVERAAAGVDARLGPAPASAAAVHALVANVFFAQDRHADAIAEFERARALYRRAAPEHAAELVEVETGLCDVHRIAGDLARAEAACLSALRRAASARRGLDVATLKLGQLRGEQGAEAASLKLLQPLLAADAFAGNPRLRGELHWAMGLAERGLGRYASARRHFEALLALHPAEAQSGTWTAWAKNSLGSVLASIGAYDEAEETLQEARRIFAATQGAGQVEAQMPNIWRGEIRLRLGQWDEAAAIQQDLLAAWRPTLRAGHPLLLKAEANLAWSNAELGRDGDARAALQAALRNRASVFDRPGDEVVVRAMRWTRAALALDDTASATRLLELVDGALPREFPGPHPVRAEADCLHATLAMRRGEPVQAQARAEACERVSRAFLAATHPQVLEAQALRAAAVRAVRPVRRESARSPAARSGP